MPSDQLATLKRAFFDRGAVAKFLDAKTRKVLSKFGAYVRRRAQTSMKTPPKKSYAAAARLRKAGLGNRSPVSPPGSPPFAHAGGKKLLRKLLFFAYDPGKKTVYIGPLRLGRTANQHVPKVLEEGGTIARKLKSGAVKRGRYRARPFMKPAFDRELGWVAAEYRKPLSSI